MANIEIPNVRQESTNLLHVALKDNGVAVDWEGLENVRAFFYSDLQRVLAGKCEVAVGGEDSTILDVLYPATQPQYLGVNSLVIRAKYHGREKTYDVPVVNFVERTAQADGVTTLEDPELNVEIEVSEVSTSLLDGAIAAALDAAEKAEEAAALVPLQVLEEARQATENAETATAIANEAAEAANAAGITSVQASVADNEPGTPSVEVSLLNKVLSLVFHHLKGAKGDTGATPNITVGTVSTGAPGTPVVITMTGTAAAPVLNITIPQGLKGEKGDQGNTGSSVEYPYELVNNLTTNDATKGLSAAQGVVLDGKISQLDQEVDLMELSLTELDKNIPVLKVADDSGWNAGASTQVGDVVGVVTYTSNATKRYAAIPVNENEVYNIGVRPRMLIYHIIFVDDDYGFISGVALGNGTAPSGLVNYEVVVPAGATLMLINSYSTAPTCRQIGYEKVADKDTMDSVVLSLAKINDAIATDVAITMPAYTVHYVWGADASTQEGDTISPASTGSTDVSRYYNAIPVSPGKTYHIGVRPRMLYFHIVFVNSSYGYISGDAFGTGTATSGLVYYDKTAPADAKYLLISTYATAAEVTEINSYDNIKGLLQGSIVSLNKDMEVAVNAASNYKYKPNGTGKMMSMLVTTDIHGDEDRFARSMQYLDAMPSIDMGICLGDIVASNFSNDNQFYIDDVNAGNKPYLTVIGNHDMGNDALVANSGTVQHIYTKFILPVRDKIGLPTLDKTYYAVQNDSYKVVIIVLNCHDVPDTLLNETTYAVSRGAWAFSQEQITWLLSTLAAVPSGYHVLLSYHWAGEANTKESGNWSQHDYNYIPNTSACYSGILGDIMNAWINGTAINKTFAPTQYTSYLPTLSVVADFSTRGSGVFVGHLTGHVHCDYIGHLTAYPSQLVMAFAPTANDNNQNFSDLDRAIGTKAEDAITVLGINTTLRKVNLVRIGANVTNTMVERSFIALSY